MLHGELNGPIQAQQFVAGVALGSSREDPVWKNDTGRTVKITAASIIPQAAHTGAATNNMTLQIRNKGLLGTGTDGVTAIKTYDNGVNLVAFKPDSLVLSTTAADLLVEAGEVLTLNKDENGTGLASPEVIVALTYENASV